MPIKLSADQVVELRQRYADGATTPELSRDYGVSFRHVSGIVSGRYWRRVGGPRTTGRFQVDGLTKEQVAMIRLLHSIGLAHTAIARIYEVSDRAIGELVNGNTHRGQ
jgi:hypothetical protein